ncbi:hypothetical protein KIL84_002169 [Mauremys mutica]|uniref:Cytochrome P450 n=1 Tax=Mauremys mutica TaxID=74926 RepID=A0A9D3XLE7_9SAUR|nr:hypothetical protein KIL84_002169 [Mauremys mutica]
MELGGAATLVLAAGVLCLALLWDWKRQQESSKFPPGPTPLPLLGNVLQLSGGDLFTSLMAADASERQKSSHRVALSRKGPLFSRRVKPGACRVILANGERWKQLRQFSLATLRSLGMGKSSLQERITEEARCLVEEIRKTNGLCLLRWG